MNDNFLYREDPKALEMVLQTLKDHPTSLSLIRLALSLEAVIAGGSAIALFEASMAGNFTHRRWTNWKDIDLWFPNQAALDAFIATAAVDQTNVKISKSFGGHALDLRSKIGGPQLQVITFRVGNPLEIISQFDFINCAVAFDGKGFWYHKEVPELSKEKKLGLQNDNSSFFLSRVNKYVSKGYLKADDKIREKAFKDICNLCDAASSNAAAALSRIRAGDFDDVSKEAYDAANQPILNKLHQAESVARKFYNLSKYDDRFFTKDQNNAVEIRVDACERLRSEMGDLRRKHVKLPYGYYTSVRL